MKKLLSISINAALLFLLGGCDVLDKYPLDKPSKETFWTNASEINGGVVACYGFLYGKLDAYVYPLVFDAITDLGFTRQDGEWKTIAKGEHDSNSTYVYHWWQNAYGGIGRCNEMLQVIEDKAHLLSEKQRTQFRGECLFLRGLYYSRLIDRFGDVPLVLKPVKTEAEAANYRREDKEVVLQQILDDYTDAANLLDDRYTVAAEIGHATRGAANAFKARVALYHGKWDIAATAANEVITSGVYELYPKYGELFQASGLMDPANKETILQYEYSAIIPRYHVLPLAMLGRNYNAYAIMVPSQNLIDSYPCIDGNNISESSLFDKTKPFENRDPRLRLSMSVPGDPLGDFQFESHNDSITCWNYATETRVTNQDCGSIDQYTSYTGYYCRKFCDPFYGDDKKEKADYPLIMCRYAEVLLTYIEAKIEADDVDASVVAAFNLIRRGRDDVKMPAVTLADFTDKDKARVLLRRERKVELAFEGFRTDDIRRWEGFWKYANRPLMGRPFLGAQEDWPDVVFDENGEPVYDYENYTPHPSSDYRVVEMRTFVQNKHELWPIPQTERSVSPQLTQNIGY